VRSRDVSLITVGGFRFGMLERVDSLAWKGLDVRVIGRGGEKGGFEGIGARTPDSGLSVLGGAHRGDKRRVVDEVLVEVNILIEDGRGDGWEGANLPRCGDGGLINGSKGKRAMNRYWSRGQINEAEIRLAKAVAIVEIADTKGRARLTQSDHPNLDKRVTAPGAHLLNSKKSISKLVYTGFPLDTVGLMASMFAKSDDTGGAPQEGRDPPGGKIDNDVPRRGNSRGRGGVDGLGTSASKIARARADRGDSSWQAGLPPLAGKG
jgi:hypothetical protein